MEKPDIKDIYIIAAKGLQPIADRWRGYFSNVYADKFKEFICDKRTLSIVIYFLNSICIELGLSDKDAKSKLILSVMREIFGAYYKDENEYIELIFKPVKDFMKIKSFDNDFENGQSITAQTVAKLYLNQLSNPSPIKVNGIKNAYISEKSYFTMIEDEPQKYFKR